MPSFRLAFRETREVPSHSVAFDAIDAGAALSIAFRHGRGRAADLWCDDRMLCHLECPDESGDFWLIS